MKHTTKGICAVLQIYTKPVFLPQIIEEKRGLKLIKSPLQKVVNQPMKRRYLNKT